MKTINRKSTIELRWLAEEILEEAMARRPPRTALETKGLLHEFELQKIELELQNQELRENVHELETMGLAKGKLEQKVARRTMSLETALREQESFSYSVSHDLRSPLRHINSYLAILCEEFGGLLPPEALSYVDRSRTACNHMGKLIDELLELSRVSRLRLVKDAVHLSDLATTICQTLHEEEPHRMVEFRISDGLLARGDKSLLMQVMVNLLSNAWKYSATIPAACIEFGKVIDADQDVFYVRDNGVGFDMAYSDKLFGAFQRLHGPEFEGNGIGLATVKRIIDRHRGKIWAESKPDEGATFYFTL